MIKNLDKKIIVGITGETERHWHKKLNEINNLGLETAALFLEYYNKKQRNLIYEALDSICLKKIPLIHARNDMSKDELKFLKEKYHNPYFTIHEDSFWRMEKWRGYYQRLYLEMNKDNEIADNVEVEKIGGFCVDLAHFKAAEEKWSQEFLYTLKRKTKKQLFACNHLSGYDYKTNEDIHHVKNKHDFDYLATLPDFVFGKVIAIEIFNSIEEQLEFKKYILKILK